eukprot:11483022-Alexandrium_andersonii.AAC.1
MSSAFAAFPLLSGPAPTQTRPKRVACSLQPCGLALPQLMGPKVKSKPAASVSPESTVASVAP